MVEPLVQFLLEVNLLDGFIIFGIIEKKPMAGPILQRWVT